MRYQKILPMWRETAELLGQDAMERFCGLGQRQPLIIAWSPPHDVLVRDLTGGDVGYLDPEMGREVARMLAGGFILLAKCHGPCLCVRRDVMVWSDGENVRTVERARESA